MQRKRVDIIDWIRFIAIAMMVFFHGAFDATIFGFHKANFHDDFFWWIQPRIIVTLFMFAVGLSLPLANTPTIHVKKFLRRCLKIGLGALGISIITYFLFPTSWVYFGTLHCIFVSSILAIPFLKRPRLSFITAILILVGELYFNVKWHYPVMDHLSMDYITVFPWIAPLLIGISVHHWFYDRYANLNLHVPKLVSYTSTHSLKIYLLHQPILYGFFYILFITLN